MASEVVDKRVNYDQIAATYNRRFAADKQASIAAALRSLARARGAQRILEIGCGTGHWLVTLPPLGSRLYGLDLSTGMLQQARQRPQALGLTRGRASRLPFHDATFDLVFCVNAIHHFDRPQAVISAARRLLSPAGLLAIVGRDPHSQRNQWYVYDYFEGTHETDLARFPAWETVSGWLVAAGFERVEWQLIDRIVAHKVGRAVLDDPFLKKNATSQLALLSDEAYAAGVSRIEAALAEAEATGDSLAFPVVISLEMLTGQI